MGILKIQYKLTFENLSEMSDFIKKTEMNNIDSKENRGQLISKETLQKTLIPKDSRLRAAASMSLTPGPQFLALFGKAAEP